VVSAYLDASGQNTDPVVVVAGFLGFPDHFEHFEKRWDAFLKEFQLDHFHATDFWTPRRPYSNWSDAQRLKAQGDICRIFSDEKGPPFGISVAINVYAFKQWLSTLDHYHLPDPHYFCLDQVLNSLIYATGPGAESLTIYCDQEKEHEALGVDIARWHEARLKKDPSLATNPAHQRDVTVTHGPKRRFVPLQLADILANDTFRMTSRFVRNGQMGDPFFTRCLKSVQLGDRERIVTRFYNGVGLIDLEYKSRARTTQTIVGERERGL